MGRMRIVWSQIWAILSPYFGEVGCHANLAVSLRAINSLKQASMQFLDRDELTNYSYQRQFLKPFEYIMRHSGSDDAKDLVVSCLDAMIRAAGPQIKSGWNVLFGVFKIGAADPCYNLVMSTFGCVQHILENYVHQITDALTECVDCLFAFISNDFMDCSLAALGLLVRALDMVPQDTESAPIKTTDVKDAKAAQNLLSFDVPEGWSFSDIMRSGRERQYHSLRVLFLTLMGLVKLLSDPRPSLREQALKALLDVLYRYGSNFSCHTWTVVVNQVLFPVFDTWYVFRMLLTCVLLFYVSCCFSAFF
jgi:brefeldin A-inhibited guanine nucleotide-exchange protein